jgi:hypothetical protein
VVEVWACIASEREEIWVRIASRRSTELVVRGRSPGHYQSERRTREKLYLITSLENIDIPGYKVTPYDSYHKIAKESPQITFETNGNDLSTLRPIHTDGPLNSVATVPVDNGFAGTHEGTASDAQIMGEAYEMINSAVQTYYPGVMDKSLELDDNSSVSSASDMLASTVLSSAPSLIDPEDVIEDIFVNVLLADPGLAALCRDGFDFMNPDRFERQLRRLIRHQSNALQLESRVATHKAAFRLTYRVARKIAHTIRSRKDPNFVDKARLFERNLKLQIMQDHIPKSHFSKHLESSLDLDEPGSVPGESVSIDLMQVLVAGLQNTC